MDLRTVSIFYVIHPYHLKSAKVTEFLVETVELGQNVRRNLEMIRRLCHFKLAEKACCKLEGDLLNPNIM